MDTLPKNAETVKKSSKSTGLRRIQQSKWKSKADRLEKVKNKKPGKGMDSLIIGEDIYRLVGVGQTQIYSRKNEPKEHTQIDGCTALCQLYLIIIICALYTPSTNLYISAQSWYCSGYHLLGVL